MTAPARPEPTPVAVPAAGAATDREDWWADVQVQFSALLTATAHRAVAQRRAS